VRDDDLRASWKEIIQRGVDALFRFRIECAGVVVEQKNLRLRSL
jgi:hypothetical protein